MLNQQGIPCWFFYLEENFKKREGKHMNFDNFVNMVRDSIKDHLPEEYENAKVMIENHRKLNNSYLGLTILKEEEKVTPTINLEQIYDYYINDPSRGNTDILSEIANIILNRKGNLNTEDIRIEELMEYEKVKKKLFIKVSSYEKNEDFLKDVPYVMKEDLAITFHIMIDMTEEGMASTIVNNSMMDNYGITKEQLYQDAIRNSPIILPARIESLVKALNRTIISEMEETGISQEEIDACIESMGDLGKDNSMIVVGNDQYIDGAAAIFYPGVLDLLGEWIHGDFYIIPSSIHETIIIPDDGLVSVEELNEIINEVNLSQVEAHERLGCGAYHYDIKEKVFERAVVESKKDHLIDEGVDQETEGFITGLLVNPV